MEMPERPPAWPKPARRVGSNLPRSMISREDSVVPKSTP